MATYRKMTQESLWIGWWGFLSAVINPITMLINLGPRSVLVALPPPIPGGPRPPMDPGRPLYERPAVIVAFALPPILALVLFVVSLTS
ncbi:hypothetical protein OHB26_33150 [Nocardia sp. NBC_01503]|uniref:hypothetical protein n=1 Tax=Nocardia sp. NBC_01503 TaxID=2975997 RepID=UPI002E7B163D|nr:hypothetical protein [Nocardia sp. NBC_01503]WTL31703.1 hypothetical protein OHB26_33150 [Nocardia sp. NBC_01503]